MEGGGAGDGIRAVRGGRCFHRPELDALQARLNITNQTIVAATKNYLAARAQVRVAEAQYFPTVTFIPSANHGRLPGVIGVSPSGVGGGGVGGSGSARGPFTSYVVAGEASWAPDLFGPRAVHRTPERIHRTGARRRPREHAAARPGGARQTYFQLRGQDALHPGPRGRPSGVRGDPRPDPRCASRRASRTSRPRRPSRRSRRRACS